MASLQFESGETVTERNEILSALSEIGVELAHWPIERTPAIAPLLAANLLDDLQKENLLRVFDDRFDEQQRRYGYQARDLVVLHETTPKLDDILGLFDQCHTHSDDEVRYVIDGSGAFGFVLPEKKQILLTIEAGEYIRVPKNTEHWFVLTSAPTAREANNERRIKAVRYFTNKEGWVANYTGTPVHAHF